MSGESTKSSRPNLSVPSANDGGRLERPFEASLLAGAAAIAARYRVVLEREEAGGFLARAVEMPTVFTSAPTPNECESKIREMLMVAVATMMEAGERPPLPVSERRVQVNVRMSAEEKMMLEEAAQRAGFRGVSEFVRFAALTLARGGG